MKLIKDYEIHDLVKKINEALDPKLEKRLRQDLKKYCEEMGKDYKAVCDLAGLSTGGAEFLSAAEVDFIEKALEKIEYGAPDPEWEYDEDDGVVNLKGKFSPIPRYGYGDEKKKALEMFSKIKFGKIEGDLEINSAELTDELWNPACPKEVTGKLELKSNKLVSPKMPKNLGSLIISNNLLESVPEGLPEEMGEFDIASNRIKSLKGGPLKVTKNYSCENQRIAEPLDLEGCAEEIGGDFDCSNNNLTSLENGPVNIGGSVTLNDNNMTEVGGRLKSVCTKSGSVRIENNNLATLEGIPLGLSSYKLDVKKNLLPSKALIETYLDAKMYGSWLAAYLKLASTTRFKRMGKAQRDPIVKVKITPEAIAANPVDLGPIWKNKDLMSDPVVKRLIKKSGVNQDSEAKKKADDSATLGDLGLL